MIPTVPRHHGGWRRTRRVPDPVCLRAIRERAGLSRRALAERVGVRESFIYTVERGTNPCSQRLLRAYEELQRP